MVPKLHPKGASFKGAALYLLHDKDRAESSERVEWTETRNLATDDPNLAWRIMAATAKDQDRLKAEAGVKNTGRKSAKHVLHLTLNWHPEQKPSREEMIVAADEALAVLGAEDRQALIVSHDDRPHKHLHILINRVSTEDGRHLSSSKERLKLSEWAQGYEERGGQIYCENRIVNNQQRDKGEYVRGDKETARHIFEQQRENLANDNDESAAVKKAQKAKDHALALRGRNLAKQQAADFAKLEDAHEQRKAALARSYTRKCEAVRKAVIEEMRPQMVALNKHQAKEAETFLAMEKNFFGRIGNALKSASIDKEAEPSTEKRKGRMALTFGALTSQTTRIEQFEARQKAARIALERRQADMVAERTKPLKRAYGDNLARNRGVFVEERGQLVERQAIQAAELRAAWKERNADRVQAYAALKERPTPDMHNRNDKASPAPDQRIEALYEKLKFEAEFKAAYDAAHEQDKDRGQDRDDGQER